MTVQEGLVFRGERIVIPSEMRRLMKTRAHAAHLGLQYTISTAREIMYWPKTHNDLTEAVRLCNICQESQPTQAKEPMMTYPLPKLPWQVMASDVFELHKSHYVVMVDIHSDYVEACPLPDLTSGTLIEVVKQVFATHGTPAVLISDNGPSYALQEFQQFAKD